MRLVEPGDILPADFRRPDLRYRLSCGGLPGPFLGTFDPAFAEHFVLNELHAHLGRAAVHYWRSKYGHEVDFVIVDRAQRQAPAAIECKWSADRFDPAGIRSFRASYPDGANYLVAADVDRPHTRTVAGVRVTFTPLPELLVALEAGQSPG